MSFAIGVWIFARTGSATSFAILSICGILPTIAALPVAGVLTDRWGPRRALLAADAGGALVGLALIGMVRAGFDSAAQLGAMVAIGSALGAIHWPAYTRATHRLCTPAQLPRAAALMQLGYAGQQVVAPAVAGIGLSVLGLSGILMLNVVTFMVAAAVVATTLAAEPRTSRDIPRTSAWSGMRDAWKEAGRLRLRRAAAYVASTHVPGGFAVALATPLVLTVSTPKRLGLIWAVVGSGMIAGSVASSMLARRTGGLKRMLRFDGLMAVGMIGMGLAQADILMGVGGFVFLFGLAGHMSEEQALWQTRIREQLQGRAMALRRLLTWSSLPFSYGLAGTLADRIFEPFMASSDHSVVDHLRPLVGSGPGRGMALMLVLAGGCKLLIAAAASFDRTLRRLNGVK